MQCQGELKKTGRHPLADAAIRHHPSYNSSNCRPAISSLAITHHFFQTEHLANSHKHIRIGNIKISNMSQKNFFGLWQSCRVILENMVGSSRFYSSKPIDLRKLRPMILKRIEDRAKDYPVKAMIPVAQEVVQARSLLYQGVSLLLQRIHVMACKYCSEVYIGESGHLIRTCGGYRRRQKVFVHEWTKGSLNDLLLPVETFHLRDMFQNVIRHDERFDYDRVPAALELCWQAGAYLDYQFSSPVSSSMNNIVGDENETMSLSDRDVRLIGIETLKAWETMMSGLKQLLLVYPAKVCKHCSEVHIGPSGHKARLCGVFKYQSWHGTHFWRRANAEDLIPPNIIWHRRRQDPPVLNDDGRNYYGHVPAVVGLCIKAGAIAPAKYHCIMKLEGLSDPKTHDLGRSLDHLN